MYYNEELVEKWFVNTNDLVMKCPICKENMDMNLRKDGYFVQNENWTLVRFNKDTRSFYDLQDRFIEIKDDINNFFKF